MSRFNDTKYVVKERRLTFGRQYRIYDSEAKLVAYVKQKMFKLKEDIIFYADETKTVEVLRLKATKILDFNSNLILTEGTEEVGVLRRRGWRSMIRDKWLVLDPKGTEQATMSEDSWIGALIRRFGPFGSLFPHKYEIRRDEDVGQSLATIKERFQIWGDTYDVTVHDFDVRLALGLAILADAGESQ
jgi:uncharacterized protein YxjI